MSKRSTTRHLRAVPSPENVAFVMPSVTPRSVVDAELTPRQTAEKILRDVDELGDPLEAEFIGSMLLAALSTVTDEVDVVAVHHFLPTFEDIGDERAAGMLSVFATIAEAPVAAAAAAARDRLLARGVRLPHWAEPLATRASVTDCLTVGVPGGPDQLLAARFEHPDVPHGMLVLLDPQCPDLAADIVFVGADELDETLSQAEREARLDDFRVTATALDPGEFRLRVDAAVRARAAHDAHTPDLITMTVEDPDTAEQQLSYHAMVPLVRARLRPLPLPVTPERATGAHARVLRLHPTPAALVRPAFADEEILQVRIDIVGATPPIWRRLLVPAGLRLDELHATVSRAFEWDETEPYVIHTADGRFGADAQHETRRAWETTLGLLRLEPGEIIRDTVGDRWAHRLRVERRLAAEPSVGYPRCVGGRRAAPPRACDGIRSYTALLAALADPTAENHTAAVELVGEAFDPAWFDPAEIDAALRGRPS